MKIKQAMPLILLIAVLAIGIAGSCLKYTPFQAQSPWFLSIALIMLGYSGLKRTYYSTSSQWNTQKNTPRQLKTGFFDYLRALICWLDSFKRTYAVPPGLYYTGTQYNKNTPLLVTANYQLTVFLLNRRLTKKNVRLLVIDTDGINVWCAAGKGTFSNEAIYEQLARYDRTLLTDDDRLRLILPKLSFAGVDLTSLRKAGYDAVIGPVYDKDLPAFLAKKPEDCDTDRVLFGMRSRLFTVAPGLVQLVKYCVLLLLAMWLVQRFWNYSIPAVEVIGIMVSIGILYPALFPYLPGKWFATKGLWLAIGICLALSEMTAAGLISPGGLIVSILFTLASGMYFGQYYSGNSAVSNMTSVRKETARLLPVYVLLYFISLVAFIVKEAL